MTAVPSASAKQPCWRTLFVDYADGRIDGTYPLHCYREAVQNLQEDQKLYGRFAQDINRALEQAISRLKQKGKHIGPGTIIPGNGPGGGSSSGPGSGTGSRNKHDEGIFYRLVHAIGPTNADSVPLPLLILAGLAFLLLAGAATSLVVRRVQARRPPPPGVPPPSL